MADVTIGELFRIQSRFFRSAHLERDFADPKALLGYVLTPEMRDHIARLASGLAANSGRRAWRITGDFGSGKSCFALLLANLFTERRTKLHPSIRQAINFKQIGIARPRLLPILITGTREPISVALLRALHKALASACGRGRPPVVLERIIAAIETADSSAVTDDTVLALIQEVNSSVVSSGKATGMLIILDELGKFLEYAAIHPEKQDVYLMQRLAEISSRSGRAPLLVVGLLHQGFGVYADQLSQAAQREWEKVAGRFDELVFDQPLEQTAELIGDALNIKLAGLPRTIAKSIRADLTATVDLGWFGAPAVKERMLANAVRFYPLHPTVLPVLVEVFRRFGQAQRSLFTFLLSSDHFGLLEFALAPVSSQQSYRLHNLYDYVRATFGHLLSVQSYRSHWNHIESLIESFSTNDAIELQVLKSIGLLNLIDTKLLATEDALVLAVASEVDGITANRVRQTITRLQREKGVLHYRGTSGGYCLWPNTSVNLERAYEDAVRALGSSPQRVAPLIESYLETRPLVARRHYIETGNLRHFEVRYAPVEKLAESVQFNYNTADGRVVVALCETQEEYQEVLRFAQSGVLGDLPDVLLAAPTPLGVLAKLVQELQRWEWVAANTSELNVDEYARKEVTRQVTNARQTLEKRIQSLVGLQQFVGKTELQWFRQSESFQVTNNRELLEIISRICDEVYPCAPIVHNELINRRSPSAAANGARTRLLDGMFSASSRPYLGMNSNKKPPEMAIYLSILEKGGIHRQIGDTLALCEPESGQDACRIRPTLQRIGEILEEKADSRVRLSDLIADLRRPPYGIRDGLSPILITLFAVVHEQHIAFYDTGVFMREMVGLDIKRLTKVPELFEIQYCKVAGVRSELFKKLLCLLEEEAPETLSRLNAARTGKKANVLDVVRPLCLFAAQLPAHTLKTKHVSSTALAVRSALLSAREPALLLFRDLPVACGLEVITTDSRQDIIELFTESLRGAIDELRHVYLLLHDRMRAALNDLFGIAGSFSVVRESLSSRAMSILAFVTEPQLKAFCLRLSDSTLAEAKWLDSLGSLVCMATPQKWTDLDVERFFQELDVLVGKFKRVESMCFEHRGRTDAELAVRVAITHLDGTERETVIFIAKEEEVQIAHFAAKFSELLNQTKRVGLAGAVQAFWTLLEHPTIPTKE